MADLERGRTDSYSQRFKSPDVSASKQRPGQQADCRHQQQPLQLHRTGPGGGGIRRACDKLGGCRFRSTCGRSAAMNGRAMQQDHVLSALLHPGPCTLPWHMPAHAAVSNSPSSPSFSPGPALPALMAPQSNTYLRWPDPMPCHFMPRAIRRSLNQFVVVSGDENPSVYSSFPWCNCDHDPNHSPLRLDYQGFVSDPVTPYIVLSLFTVPIPPSGSPCYGMNVGKLEFNVNPNSLRCFRNQATVGVSFANYSITRTLVTNRGIAKITTLNLSQDEINAQGGVPVLLYLQPDCTDFNAIFDQGFIYSIFNTAKNCCPVGTSVTNSQNFSPPPSPPPPSPPTIPLPCILGITFTVTPANDTTTAPPPPTANTCVALASYMNSVQGTYNFTCCAIADTYVQVCAPGGLETATMCSMYSGDTTAIVSAKGGPRLSGCGKQSQHQIQPPQGLQMGLQVRQQHL